MSRIPSLRRLCAASRQSFARLGDCGSYDQVSYRAIVFRNRPPPHATDMTILLSAPEPDLMTFLGARSNVLPETVYTSDSRPPSS